MLLAVRSSPNTSSKSRAAAAAKNVNVSFRQQQQSSMTHLVEGHPSETPDARADQVSPLLDLAKLL